MPDREKVICQLEKMRDYHRSVGNNITADIANEALSLLKEQDTKTGYWITEEPNTYTRRTYCSVCGKSAPFIYVSDDYYGGRSHGETKKTKYCPNCGAKMET